MNSRRTDGPVDVPRTSIRARGGTLVPGGVVGDGRYRLLAQLGVDERANAYLWRARDGQLRRDVALTLLVGDPADPQAARRARRTLERAAHAARFHHAAVARVLDVLSLGSGISTGEGLLGIVVSEWSKGTDLIDIVDDGPVSVAEACRMLEPLVEAVERAHHSGLVLGLDHPQRLRRGVDGKLRLAFPGPLPDATLRDDMKALGAALYLLLTGRWALEGGPAALPTAPHTPDGRVVPPRSLQPRVPAELSALAVRTISDSGAGGGIRTSAAFLRLLRQVADAAEHQELGGEEVWHTDPDGTVWTTKKPVSDAKQRKKVALGATALVVAAVCILAWIGLQLISFFQTEPDPSGPDVNVAESGETRAPEPTEEEAPPPATGDPVEPSDINVYSPEGTPDHSDRAGLAIDGDSSTVWTTDQYRQQLPALKPGVGLGATFNEPITLTEVELSGLTPGTVIEIRIADAPNAPLDETRVVASAEATSGELELSLDEAERAGYVIVWLTKLGGQEGAFQSQIAEINYIPEGQSG